MATANDLRSFTFTGPADAMCGGQTTVQARTELEARHLAMVARWGRPNGRPAADTGPDGRYLSAGLSLVDVAS